ncbi:tRNA (adenosine(37)-N6)-dimethylallyltransferase MiaA [Tabrizicola thermarum]|uniref:tRNA (adenosine(37)-N6)-dimethylallyltransferase MiaA n=1 Tax=Tabrizicola thermarum TaxID=2670345 RepID=UPI001EE41D9E|nr:tRNA (adenosine(37)-N6)-dimethylallyltransferase MiaA [Tabrizicola thermarum]
MVQIDSISREAPVLIAGPTASGKSALAMELAARDNRLIVNADALQVYANWRVLTARPSPADEAAAPHALYGHVPRETTYSVGHWLREVAPLLSQPVVIVGGTGLNFNALTRGLAEVPDVPPAVRAEANARRAAEGHAALLSELDAATAARIDRQNPVRIQRAWEVLRATGRGLASWQDNTPPPLLALDRAEALVLVPDVAWLNDRIARRFRQMLSDGALDEARANLADWDPGLPSSKAIGAAELIAHLRGELALSDATDAAVLASRQYAKRQRTWFRSNMKVWRQVSLP